MKNSKNSKLASSIFASVIISATGFTAGANNLFEYKVLGSGEEVRATLLNTGKATKLLELSCGDSLNLGKIGDAQSSDSLKLGIIGDAPIVDSLKLGKVGDAKCGDKNTSSDKNAKKKSAEGKCGEGKCGEGKCGDDKKKSK